VVTVAGICGNPRLDFFVVTLSYNHILFTALAIMLKQKVLLLICHNVQGTKASVVTVIDILGNSRLAYFVMTTLAIMLKQKVLLLFFHNAQLTKASVVTVAGIFGEQRLTYFVITPGYNCILFTALAIMLKQKVLLLICHSTQGTKTTIVTVTGIFASLKLVYFLRP
jgi:hypothetical protein